jgi:hypothetical protein
LTELADIARAFVGEFARRIDVPESVAAFMLAMALLAVLYLAIRVLHPARRRKCKWRRQEKRSRRTLSKYRCRTCGVEAFTATGKPPVDCKKGLKPKPL